MKNLVHVIEIEDRQNSRKYMEQVGVHEKGISIMAPKAQFRTVKIKDLPVTAANIIKQEMLVRGGDVATAYGAVNHSVSRTDVLIFGTELQLKSLIKKLRSQYFGLREIALDIEEALDNYDSVPEPIKIGKKKLDFGRRTYVMGILNVTNDSFSDGGMFIDVDAAVDHAKGMVRDGADIIDVGGESSRPGSRGMDARTEISRVIPVIKRLKKETDSIISIDTTKSKVAAAAVEAGAHMVNDISGLRFDNKMASVVSSCGVPIVVMHILGKPRTMQKKPSYKDLISDIIIYLKNSIELAIKRGIQREKIIVDPGIGFGKTTEHNLEILKRLREFKSLGQPVLVGTSRKSLIGNVLDLSVDQRIEGTAATVAAAVLNGANIVRVHDVKEMCRVIRMTDAIKKA